MQKEPATDLPKDSESPEKEQETDEGKRSQFQISDYFQDAHYDVFPDYPDVPQFELIEARDYTAIGFEGIWITVSNDQIPDLDSRISEAYSVYVELFLYIKKGFQMEDCPTCTFSREENRLVTNMSDFPGSDLCKREFVDDLSYVERFYLKALKSAVNVMFGHNPCIAQIHLDGFSNRKTERMKKDPEGMKYPRHNDYEERLEEIDQLARKGDHVTIRFRMEEMEKWPEEGRRNEAVRRIYQILKDTQIFEDADEYWECSKKTFNIKD